MLNRFLSMIDDFLVLNWFYVVTICLACSAVSSSLWAVTR